MRHSRFETEEVERLSGRRPSALNKAALPVNGGFSCRGGPSVAAILIPSVCLHLSYLTPVSPSLQPSLPSSGSNLRQKKRRRRREEEAVAAAEEAWLRATVRFDTLLRCFASCQGVRTGWEEWGREVRRARGGEGVLSCD